MTILITGTSGHLGEGIARTLTDRGINYVGVDINHLPDLANILT